MIHASSKRDYKLYFFDTNITALTQANPFCFSAFNFNWNSAEVELPNDVYVNSEKAYHPLLSQAALQLYRQHHL